MNGMQWMFETMDAWRRRQGNAFDLAGLGPREVDCQIDLDMPALRLRCYGGPEARAVLAVPAPIKRHYIWDLLPDCSAVRRLLDAGYRVYLIEWKDPQGEMAEAGLQQYGSDWIDACVQRIRQDCPQTPLVLISHSLGGIFATIYASLHPEQVRALVLLEVPLHFGKASGAFLPLLLAAPPTPLLLRDMTRVPGSLLSMVSAMASPRTFHGERAADFAASLASPADLQRHMLVERWALDEAPMANLLFEQIVEDLYRNDKLMRGTLEISGTTIGPAQMRVPLFAVHDPASDIIPSESVTTYVDAAASDDKALATVESERGTGLSHVAALVGPRAHALLWPRILSWLRNLPERRTGA